MALPTDDLKPSEYQTMSKPISILQGNTKSLHYLPAEIAANRNRITNENFIAPQIHSVEMWLKKTASSSETAPTL